MKALIITGDERYIRYLFKHLLKEHPSTKKRMVIRTCRKKH